MRRYLSLLLGLMFFSQLVLAEKRVAIFDYDYRPPGTPSIALLLAQQLRQWEPSLTLTSLSARNDKKTATRLLKQLDQENWDLIIVITTDAFQLALHHLQTVPFVFTNVNNPKAFGIENRSSNRRNFTGASYYVPALQQLKFILAIQPDIRRLGFLFDPENRSMLIDTLEVREACKKLNIEFSYRKIGDTTTLLQSATELYAEGADALIATNSDRIYLHISRINEGLKPDQIPIYSFNAAGVEQGAVAALASDYTDMAHQLVLPRVKAILNGDKLPGDLPIGYLDRPQPFVNIEAIKQFGLTNPTP